MLRGAATPATQDIKDVEPKVDCLRTTAYTIPTDQPESDGTLTWTQTTLVVVRISAGDVEGLGYSYADKATACLIHELLKNVVIGKSALDIPAAWSRMNQAIRNLGRPGICSMAIAAVDNALWDLKARLLDLPLVMLLGAARDSVPIYGSGGFTSYSIAQLVGQLSGWASDGIPRVKMKIGRNAHKDPDRVRAARDAVGEDVDLYVDANGAYTANRP